MTLTYKKRQLSRANTILNQVLVLRKMDEDSPNLKTATAAMRAFITLMDHSIRTHVPTRTMLKKLPDPIPEDYYIK